MNRFQRALPTFRSLWSATGFWGPAWALWTVAGFLVQAVVVATRPADQELRQNVNLVFVLGTLALMFQVMSRIREWQDAQTPPPTGDAASAPEEADSAAAPKAG